MSIHGIHDWVLRHPMVWDAVLALILWLPSAAGTTATHFSLPRLAWSLLYAVPLVWRRTRPDVAAAGVALACLIQLFVQNGPNGGNLCVPVVIYTVVTYGNSRRARWWLWTALAGSVAAGVRWTKGDEFVYSQGRRDAIVNGAALAVVCAITVLLSWYAGRFARERRLNLESLRTRAEDLERERDQRVKLATQEERTRIAREMHDIVAHSLSVIVVQADGGAYLAHHREAGDDATRLEASGKALDTIAETARQALAETRRLVGVLRDDSDQTPELAPSRGLADLPDLIAETRQALPVELTVCGDPSSHPPLPEGAGLAAYRVVQESLTNVIKHAGPGARAEVTVTHSPGTVDLTIVDDGRGSTQAEDDGAGHGLVGMRERVSAWGGRLEAGDREGGGFQVHAAIPAEH